MRISSFDELRHLKFADMGMKRCAKLVDVLTDAGRALRDNGYQTTRVILRITEPRSRSCGF